MKYFYTLLFTVVTFSTTAQYGFPSLVEFQMLNTEDYYHQKNQREKESLQKNKVQSRTVLHYIGDKKTKSVETYDQFGNILTYDHYDKKGQHSVSYRYTYDSKQRPVLYTYKYGKKQSWNRVEYDASGLLKRSRGYNSKGDYFGREEFKREDGKMLAITIWEKDSLSPQKRLDYEYYEDGSLKTIRYFFKSKLKYTWSYDCKPEGELLGVKQKDSTTICIKEEYDAQGNRVVWKQEFNRKGDLVKTKMVFDKDSTLLLIESYSADEILQSQHTFFKDGGDLYFSYGKKSKIQYMSESIYNLNKQLAKRSTVYGRQFSNTWYSYEGDLIKSHTYMNRHQTSFSEYSYTYFGN
jgi:hypothetical protein